MKYVKMLGLAAFAAALMALAGAGTASATELTCTEPAGTAVMCKAGTIIHAESVGKATLDSPIGEIKCNSTVKGPASTGGSTETVSGTIETLSFTNCGLATVVVEKSGELIIHTDAMDAETGLENRNGTLTSNGAVVTVETFGAHCIYETSNTDIGTVSGSTTNGGGTPLLTISANIPRTGGRSGALCGSTAPWTGSYSVDTPMWMDIH